MSTTSDEDAASRNGEGKFLFPIALKCPAEIAAEIPAAHCSYIDL